MVQHIIEILAIIIFKKLFNDQFIIINNKNDTSITNTIFSEISIYSFIRFIFGTFLINISRSIARDFFTLLGDTCNY